MGKIRTLKTSFVSGELAQEVFGRVDKDFYAKGADKLRNVYVDPLGGVYKREGLRIINKNHNNEKVCLVSFSFNTEQSYLLAFYNQRMEVYKDNSLVSTFTANEILNNITTEILKYIKFTQSADTLIITHNSIRTIKITRTSHTNWTFAYLPFDYIPVHCFTTVNVSEPSANLTFSNLLGYDITITSSSGIFNSSHVKQKIIAKTGGVFLIKEIISPTSIKGDIVVEFAGDNSTTQDNNSLTYEAGDWQLETGYEDAWSETRGYPNTCTFYQDRLWFGGSRDRPATLWGSKSGEYFNFNIGGGKADDAIDLTISSDKVNPIVNIFAGRNLQVFTTGGEFYIPQTENDPLKPDNIQLKEGTSHGSTLVKPISVDGSTLFIESEDNDTSPAFGGRIVREFIFNDVEKSYNAKNISLLSSQLIRDPVRMDVKKSTKGSPANYVFVLNSDGTIAVLNILRAEQLLAWSLFDTQGVIEELCIVNRKEVYVSVKRNIGGQDVRFIEKFEQDSYLDCSMVSNKEQVDTEHEGFNYLKNQKVKVRSNTFVLSDNEIDSDGIIQLNLDYKNIEVGLGFNILIRTLPIDIDLGGKTLTGDWRRLIYALVKTHNSRSFKVLCGKNTYIPVFRTFGSDVLDSEIKPYSGWKKVYLSGGFSRDAYLDIVQDEPVDFYLVSMVIAVTIS